MGCVLVVDKDPDACAAIQVLLGRLGREVIAAETLDTAVALVHERSPDLVVLDVDTVGLVLCTEVVERSEASAVILTSAERTSPADRVAGLLAGADDYVCKPFDPDELLARARRTLARRERCHGAAHPAPWLASALSPREREVLALLADGLTQRQIATALVISHKTVGSHVQHILAKLGVHSRAQAIAFALSAAPDGDHSSMPAQPRVLAG